MIDANTLTSPHLSSSSIHAGAVRIFSDPVPYLIAWEIQSRLHEERLLDLQPDTVLILEHPPVYTLGRRTNLSHWGGNESALCADGAELHHVNRGGSVTFHGPGQIVVYPVLKLERHAAGPRRLIWLLEEVIIRVLDHWNITGSRVVGKPGVWIMTPEPQKIAFLGIRIEHGVTLHGFALNVDLALTPFQRIHPCGFPDCRVTSMAAVRQTAVPVGVVKQELAQTFAAVFDLNWSTVA
ncbi:MAG TPA: lipoyl(octanoyl) transferase LipB [Nitrospira sp.]|nr:lipoyl(octanoyl) transferase LipB [Nitrospira sp.]